MLGPPVPVLTEQLAVFRAINIKLDEVYIFSNASFAAAISAATSLGQGLRFPLTVSYTMSETSLGMTEAFNARASSSNRAVATF